MFKGDYLRVLSPVTSDGISPVVENDRIKYREDHLPLTAKKMLEKKNERLPTGLRKKIEVVSDRTPARPAQSTSVVLPEDNETEDLDLQGATGNENIPPAAPKGKGGRPKKDLNA